MNNANAVRFVRCTQGTFEALNPPDSNTLYFLIDAGKIYLGSVLVTPDIISMYPDIVKNITPQEGSIIVTFWDDSETIVPIDTGGLDFDSMVFDQDTSMLHLQLNGEDVIDPCLIPSSSGGGGSGNNAVLTLTNTTGWISKTLSETSDCVLSGNWSSIEQDTPTGNGNITIKVGGVTKHTSGISQGNFTINVKPYLLPGSNSVRLTITDVYGNAKSINFTINLVALSLESTFDGTVPFTGQIQYTYVPTGNVTKIVHFILDGEEIGTSTVDVSGRQRTFTIPGQSHGVHSFEVYFTAEIEGEDVESNHLYYDLICTELGNNTPIISSVFNQETIQQYETVNIHYIVYSPASLTSQVTLKVNGNVLSQLSGVDRTQQNWAYRADTVGPITLSIECGGVKKEFTSTVTPTQFDVDAETENLELFLSSYGRSNNEPNKDVWEYEGISCDFAGYNWQSDGWQSDENGITVHRVSGDARLTIPLQLFASDFFTSGKTIEIEFATHGVLDYDATIISCWSGDPGIGLKLTAQKAVLKTAQAEISTQYKENEHIRLSFVVEKKSEQTRLIYIYLNGVMCGAAQYPADDRCTQLSPVNITIGSNSCTVDLYNIRTYNNNLTRYQILDNWIADTQDINDKIARYTRNNIYNTYGAVVIDQLPSNLPYMVLEAPVLPQSKGDKKTVGGYYVDPQNGANSFTFENAQADVQGTSSQGYARKNYKIKYKGGFIQDNVAKENYAMRPNSIPTSTFTFKADVASSEGANNVELVRLYNDICPYLTPGQQEDSRVRQGIDGFPMVIFQDAGNGPIFIGKYNFNNDKGTPEVFGLKDDDESWEVRNNTSSRVLFLSDDFSDSSAETGWPTDYEARHPEDYMDISQIAEFTAWVVSTDPDKATNAELGETISHGGVSFTHDTREYRLAKFRAELGDYVELDSCLFYYLFTEMALMVDSRAKNMFPSPMGESIGGGSTS